METEKLEQSKGDNGWCIHTCTTIQFWQFWRHSFMVNMWISVTIMFVTVSNFSSKCWWFQFLHA